MRTPLPVELKQRVERDWQAYQQALQQAGLKFEPAEELKQVIFRVWACSAYISQLCIQQPLIFPDLVRSGDLNRDYRATEYRVQLNLRLQKVKNEQQLMAVLREFRQREMLRIAWRDLAGWAPLTEILRDLSLLADACVDLALAVLFKWACKQWGIPKDTRGQTQQMVVLGMGKLGAWELNFSSDIDLIFAYPEEGQIKKRRGLSHDEFFTRLGQSLIQVIDNPTSNGFVFRVDMRLRPYGESGGLVQSFSALEDYYQYQGREWERYAMIKARVIAGDVVAGNQLLKLLRPFTYRRYIDYGAFASLRELKAMIAQQVQRKGMEHNIKLGRGGIREIEFIGQAFQLIRGGREPDLQVRGIIPVLKKLAEKNYLPDYVTRQLLDAYHFLRFTENHLQAYAEQQTHLLPSDELEKNSLAFSMGFESWESFNKKLEQHRQTVQEAFDQVMAAPQIDHKPADTEAQLAALWQGRLDKELSCSILNHLGYHDLPYVYGLIDGLRESHAYKSRNKLGQERLDHLIPLVLGAVAQVAQPDQCLLRVINLLEAISGRSTYMSLLAENPVALSQLVKLFADSSWIAEYLTQHPVLLDQLLDSRSLYAALDKTELNEELAGLLSYIDADDLEQQMESLRYFKQSNVLHVAAADLTGCMSLVEVSHDLSEIADICLNSVLDITRQYLYKKYGEPVCVQNGEKFQPGFVVIGYGKLGGYELGYGSDLDLVFLHNSQGEKQSTSGKKQVDNPVFFARLGQRMIHMMNTATASGILYEVDMRLRPSGASGMLVSDIQSYQRYQQEDAWTWEHQALVRARAITGDPELIDAFNQVRREILCVKRDPVLLKKDVTEMRERMRTELGSKQADSFHLKQDTGGMVDIEFMVQYLILCWAWKYPQLIEKTDNLSQIASLQEAGLLTAAQAGGLSEAYQAYRARVHRALLTDQSSVMSGDAFVESRGFIRGLWSEFFGV